MLKKLIHAVIGDPNEREINRIQPIVDEINALESTFQELSDEQLKNKTTEFKERLSHGETLDDILPEAFAAVREASVRTIGLRHYDVQLIGGIFLHEGKIAEMKTGEGKTLVATLPLYLNSLEGNGAHLVTPNDYLAKVGVQWMGPIYDFLGVSVAVIQSQTANTFQPAFIYDSEYSPDDDRYLRLRQIDRRDAYNADITYGTNNEFGFDYLRDNMARRAKDRAQGGKLNYAIIDEIDNILIDEARTPLIISGPADEPSDMYKRMASIVRGFKGIEQKEYEDLEERAEKFGDEKAAREMQRYDYVWDAKARVTSVLEPGVEKAERALGVDNLYDPDNFELTHFLNNAIRAKALYQRDNDYIVSDDGQVIIVDEFTGRLMYGRRFSEGLHQAIEAKEGVEIQRENMTLATITFQNFFRMYDKLAGMTGTAVTEAEEFDEIYDLEVVEIPTNEPVIRDDYDDVIYKSQRGKFDAVVREIARMHINGRPVLVGTASIDTSEALSRRLSSAEVQDLAVRDLDRYAELNGHVSRSSLRDDEALEEIAALWDLPSTDEETLEKLQNLLRYGIDHEVLNAKQHEREAEIIAQAGRPGAITIATNMAGRGVDILLGGNPEGLARRELRQEYSDLSDVPREEIEKKIEEKRERIAEDKQKVLDRGGLHIIGTERHDARRIDNQLRGRAGRQGDPGSSRFYISLEDELMQRFGGNNLRGLMDRLGLEEDVPIEHGMINKAIENAQTKVEGYNFDIRKRVLEYDDVVNQQREVIYDQRAEVLETDNLRPEIERMIHEKLDEIIHVYLSPDDFEREPDYNGLYHEVRTILPVSDEDINVAEWEKLAPEEIKEQLWEIAMELYDEREESFDEDVMRELERQLMLDVVDKLWVQHLTALDELRSGIGLRAIAQQDPLVAYKREAYDVFGQLIGQIEDQIVRKIFLVQPVIVDQAKQRRVMHESHPDQSAMAQAQAQAGGNGRSGGGSSGSSSSSGGRKKKRVKKVKKKKRARGRRR